MTADAVLAMPWSTAVATSVGSLPGTEPIEAARIVVGELGGFVHVAELPARGPGADMIGRTGGMLAAVSTHFALETTPAGWRLTSAPGRQMRQAWSMLGEDLDALEEQTRGYTGPVKVQVVGPWTLAAALELRTGERALRDELAVRDIAQGLAEAIDVHVADVRRRLPKASAVVVQLDEPALPAVLEGRIGTASGLSTYRAVDGQDAERVLRQVIQGRGDAVVGVHCCDPGIPVDLLRTSGAAFVSLDLVPVENERTLDDPLGRAFEAGLGILAGCVPSTGVGPLGDAQASAPLRALLHRLGLEDPTWLDQVAITPSCGMAGASPAWVRTALAACTAVGRVVRQDQTDGAEAADDSG
ncbi:MAG: methionine synthase [Actinomycetes bacterium]